MTLVLPSEQKQADFAQTISQAWREAHGADKGRVHVSWGEDRVVVLIEDALLKGERLLAQSEQGKVVLEQYVQELIAQLVEEQKGTLAELLGREIIDNSVSVNTLERWITIIFRLAGVKHGFG